MKANRKQTAVKLPASKIGTDVMVRVVTKYGEQCLLSEFVFAVSDGQKPGHNLLKTDFLEIAWWKYSF